MKRIHVACALIFLLASLLLNAHIGAAAGGTTYYVSESLGNDNNNGLSEGAPFESINKVNSLNLGPGDRVLFKCGDTWRAQSLVIVASGTGAEPLQFGSYPAGCADKPIISGAQPISGWAVHSGNIYVANLSAGANAGKFPAGLNQLFQGAERLPFGRWPDLNNGDGGYQTIDGHNGDNITDNQLPAGNWTRRPCPHQRDALVHP